MKTIATILALAVAAPALAAPDGAVLFQQNCSACHQAAGQGIPGAFPALAKNKFVNGDPKAVAATLINGRGGMPSFKDSLKDDQLSAILTFVRHSWGNNSAPIPAATFTAARNGGKMQQGKPMPIH